VFLTTVKVGRKLRKQAQMGKIKEMFLGRKCPNIKNPIHFGFQMPRKSSFSSLFVRSFADTHLDLNEGLEHGHQLLDQLDQQLH
jgi:hypothetical protein